MSGHKKIARQQVLQALKEALGFSPRGDVFPIGSLPRQEGKAKRVFFRKNGEDQK